MTHRLDTENKIVGTKQVVRGLNSDEIKTVYLAKDVDLEIKKKLLDLARSQETEIVEVDTMKELGKACEIDISAAVAALLK